MSFQQIFIVGAPRSGTTFAASLLESSSYGVPVESHFISKYYQKLDSFGDLNNLENFSGLVRAILSERPVMQWDIEPDIEALHASLEKPVTYAGLVNRLCAMRADRIGTTAWGDKTPRYVEHIDSLATLFPRARFIWMVRDGRDVAMSLLDRSWGPNNLYACATYWRDLNEAGAKAMANIDDGRLLKIRYEDLLEEPQPVLSTILDFLDEPYDKTMLQDLTRETRQGNKLKWKTALSASEIELFESVAKEQLHA
ncbi:MAG: sulfotransferase, partial [Pseudomonadota bacterium]